MIRTKQTKALLSEIRKGREEIRYATGKSTLGAVLVASGDRGVVFISVGASPQELVDELELRFPEADIAHGDRDDEKLAARVVDFLESPTGKLDLTLDFRGTAFQKRVWKEVQKIPIGRTSTYTEIARKIGAPKAMRAVGTACANCDHSIAVPCHRVLRSDGTFRGGDYWDAERHGIMIGREKAAAKRAAQTSSAKRSQSR